MHITIRNPRQRTVIGEGAALPGENWSTAARRIYNQEMAADYTGIVIRNRLAEGNYEVQFARSAGERSTAIACDTLSETCIVWAE